MVKKIKNICLLTIITISFSCSLNETIDLPINTINWEKDQNDSFQFYTNSTEYYGYCFFNTFQNQSNSTVDTFEIELKKISGSMSWGYGMTFNYIDIDNYSYFIIDSTGYFKIGENNSNGYTTFRDWNDDHSINSGLNVSNILKVEKEDYYYKFYINDIEVHKLYRGHFEYSNESTHFGFLVDIGTEQDENFPNEPVDVRINIL